MKKLIFIVVCVLLSQVGMSQNFGGSGSTPFTNQFLLPVCDSLSDGRLKTVYVLLNGIGKPTKYFDGELNAYTPFNLVDSGCTTGATSFSYDKEKVCYSDGTDTLEGWQFTIFRDSSMVDNYLMDLDLDKVAGTVIPYSNCECNIIELTDTTYADTVVWNFLEYMAQQDSINNVRNDTIIDRLENLELTPTDTLAVTDIDTIQGRTITLPANACQSISVTLISPTMSETVDITNNVSGHTIPLFTDNTNGISGSRQDVQKLDNLDRIIESYTIDATAVTTGIVYLNTTGCRIP